jgi:two-component system, NtrC family, sensor kinase
MKSTPFLFPIRLKILLTMLVFITAVVSAIVFTMASLFHADKAVYIRGLTAEMATHMASEANITLASYQKRLNIFGRILFDADLYEEQKSDLVKALFAEFPEFVAVTIYQDGQQTASVFDLQILKTRGVSRGRLQDQVKAHPLPLDDILKGATHLENITFDPNLPLLSMAIPFSRQIDGRTVVVAGLIQPEALMDLIRRSKVFEAFLVDPQGYPLAHPDPTTIMQHVQVKWISQAAIIQNAQSQVLSIEFQSNQLPMIGAVARLNFGTYLAGVQIPLAAAYLTSKALLKNLATVSLVILMIATLLSFIWSHYLTRSIDRLSHAARKIGQGQFDIHVKVPSRDEIGQLSQSFNHMAGELNYRDKALKETQAALIQSEKMAAFGQIGAGIAHEVKNPLAGILGLTQISLRKIEKDTLLHQNLTIIEKETRRCKTIIENLLKFARQEKISFTKVNINQIVDDAATIVDHQLGINHIRLKKHLAEGLPDVRGNTNQLQQVLLNLLINAQQAMDGQPGRITLSTGLSGDGRVEIRVKDTGKGIPPDEADKIFEPFFSTKPVGQGTGLGLSVSYGIIKEHHGDISVISQPGQGAEFIITLPVWKQSDETAAA